MFSRFNLLFTTLSAVLLTASAQNSASEAASSVSIEAVVNTNVQTGISGFIPVKHDPIGFQNCISSCKFTAFPFPAKHEPVHVPIPVPVPVLVPVKHEPVHVPVHETVTIVPHSFDRWGGFDSLRDFDSFYGVTNFDGYGFEQVFVKKEKELVCRVQRVGVVQQRLLVLQEMAKRIVTELSCEVEVQTIVFEQFNAGLHGFGRDLVRFPGGHHRVGFDEGILGHFPKFLNRDGSLNVDDWGFTGRDLGKHTVVVKGHTWDERLSFKSVRRAWRAARNAYFSLHGEFF